jgi:hypothetical protein
MRTMSWSRYHTFTRVPTRLRRRTVKRMRHAAKAGLQKVAEAEPERQTGDATGRSLARIRQSLTRIFRTWRLRNRTDI